MLEYKTIFIQDVAEAENIINDTAQCGWKFKGMSPVGIISEYNNSPSYMLTFERLKVTATDDAQLIFD